MIRVIENKGAAWQLSQYKQGKWHKISMLERIKEPPWLMDWEVDEKEDKVAIMELHMQKIERMYERIPHIHVLIAPKSIFDMAMRSYQLQDITWQSEIASTLDERERREQLGVVQFLMCFYASSSLKNAYRCYEIWQYTRCLKDEVGNKLVDLFEIYEEEVFNYFKYKACLETYPWLKEKRSYGLVE